MELSDIKRQIQAVFDPLAVRLGLSGLADLSLSATDLHVGYANKKIGLEIEVEMVDFFVYALVFRPTNNGIPLGYNDKTGRRQKLYYFQALQELSIDATNDLRILQELGGDYRNCREMVNMLARMVEHYWPDVSRDPARWFS